MRVGDLRAFNDNITPFYQHREFYYIKFAQQTMDYVTGGITFTYPTNLFTQPPQVIISVQLVSELGLETLYVPCIVSNSVSSTTVRVNSLLGLVIDDVASGVVQINVWATGI